MAFRLIPAGAFRMGSRGYAADEEPIHRVQIVEPFWLAETPVTQAQFALWTRAERILHENHFQGHPEHPAENLDWWHAQDYCAWLTRVMADRLPGSFRIACLPTEAEWEYACRAGTDTEYHTGDGDAALAEAGWSGETWGFGSTHPVRQKAPNAFHLYDMHGNVWEWCHDAWDEAAYRQCVDEAPDPVWKPRLNDWRKGLAQMMQSDDYRVLRGDSWFLTAGLCRSALRIGFRPGDRFRRFGFRVCLVKGPATGGGAQPDRAAETQADETGADGAGGAA